MKKLILVLLLVIVGADVASANNPKQTPQEEVLAYEDQTFWQRFLNWSTPDLETHHEFRIGMGYPDLPHFNNFGYDNYNSGGLYGSYTSSREVAGVVNTIPSPYVRYMSRWGNRFEWGVGGMFVHRQQNLYNTVTSDVIKNQRVNSLVLLPEIRWNVIRASWIRFHISLGTTCVFSHTNDNGFMRDYSAYVGWGYTIGGRVFLFCEGTASDYTFDGIIGVGYRF